MDTQGYLYHILRTTSLEEPPVTQEKSATKNKVTKNIKKKNQPKKNTEQKIVYTPGIHTKSSIREV